VASQLVGRKRVRLDASRKFLLKAADRLAWLERFVKPRHGWFCMPRADRLIGAVCFLLALLLFLPIPFASIVPALALSFFALGLVKRDGILIAGGWLVVILAAVATQLVTMALAQHAPALISTLTPVRLMSSRPRPQGEMVNEALVTNQFRLVRIATLGGASRGGTAWGRELYGGMGERGTKAVAPEACVESCSRARRGSVGRRARGRAMAAADTIAEAMASAYLGNPTLQAERARQRATDEQVPQALSGWRPTVVLRVDGGYEWGRSTTEGPAAVPVPDPPTVTRTTSGDNTPARVSIGLSQPIFRGFRTVSETARAEANVAAGGQILLAVEQQVLLDASVAYMNVLRDREIVVMRQRTVEALGEQQRGAQARFDVGEITRTDVEQARARLSRAEAELAAARANLAASAALYVQVIGHAPGTLRYPEVSARVPRTLEEALAIANRLNPQLLAAAFNAEAARHQIDFVQADLLPSISLEADFRATRDPTRAC
jgi:hypothetical protein